jgi:hypothetical protein
VPVWSKPYPTPLKNRNIFKEGDEVYHQCDIGALCTLSANEIEEQEWASPCFGIPKKDGLIRLVTDFCKLNSALKQKEYTLMNIGEMFQNIHGFTFASTINLNMGYLSIPLTKKTKKLLTIVTQFRFFECCVLPMGIKPATEIFQSRMVGIFQDMQSNKPNPYIDDIFHGNGENFNSHFFIRDEIFSPLKEAGMQVNLDKSNRCTKSVVFLGFLLQQNRYQPT